MASNKSILKVSLALTPASLPSSSQERQDDLMARMLEFNSPEQRIAVGRSSSGRSPIPSLFNALFHSRSVSRQHAELSVDPRTNLLMVEDLRSMHGTYLNGTKLASGITHYVHSGDLLQFGSDIQHENRGHFAPRSFKVSYGSAPPTTKHTVPIQARRPGSFKVPETTTDEEEEDSEVEVLDSTDTSFVNRSPEASGLHPVEIMSDSEDEIQVLSVTKRKPAGIALEDLFTDDDDECATPLSFQAVPSTSTSQATVKRVTSTMETQPSQERMRISNILAEDTEIVSSSNSQAFDLGAEIDLEQNDPEPEAELELELPSGHGTVPDVDVVEDETAVTASKMKVQEPHEKEAITETQMASDVLPTIGSLLDMLDGARIAAPTTFDALIDYAEDAQDSEQVQQRLEKPLTRTTPDVRAYLAGAEGSLLSRATKRQREDDTMAPSTSFDSPAQPGDISGLKSTLSATGERSSDSLTTMSSEHVHKRARHDAPVISIPINLPKRDRKAAAPATWQATIKPFMLGALVGGMGVFGGLLSMADMQ